MKERKKFVGTIWRYFGYSSELGLKYCSIMSSKNSNTSIAFKRVNTKKLYAYKDVFGLHMDVLKNSKFYRTEPK